jgi:hypothetical protein
MGMTKPMMQEFLPLLSRVEKRLMGITPFTSYADRLTLNNAVLSALPTYFRCVVQLLVEIIDQINKYQRHYLWQGSDLHKKGNCLVVWSKVQRPKSQSGLGNINLSAQNKGLLLKHLHKFFNKVDVPWVDLTWKAFYSASLAPQARSPRGSFWWRALCQLFDQYRGYAKAIVCKGDATLF